MSFELREHTADVGVEARGPDLGAVFAAVADGLASAMCDDVPPGGERFSLTVRAESREALLFDYLDELIYERDVRGVLPVDNRASVSAVDAEDDPGTESTTETGARTGTRTGTGRGIGPNDEAAEWVVEASARGVPFSAVTAREVKAVTYSEMRLERTDDGWHAYVVFDV